MCQKEVRGQKLVCVPDDDTLCCFMQRLSQHQSVGKQITNDHLEKGFTRNTARSWRIALDPMGKLEICLKKLTADFPEIVKIGPNSRNEM